MADPRAAFKGKAPWVMRLLMRDFALDVDGAAAILGNIGHECGGFRLLQEIKPTVAGSAGGYGWRSWTGARRRLYMAYCLRNGLDPASDQANYGFLFVEMKGAYRGAIAAIKAMPTLRGKVIADELMSEMAGVKAYDSRLKWAQVALEAYHTAPNTPLPDWAVAAGTPALIPVPMQMAAAMAVAAMPAVPAMLAQTPAQMIAAYCVLSLVVMAFAFLFGRKAASPPSKEFAMSDVNPFAGAPAGAPADPSPAAMPRWFELFRQEMDARYKPGSGIEDLAGLEQVQMPAMPLSSFLKFAARLAGGFAPDAVPQASPELAQMRAELAGMREQMTGFGALLRGLFAGKGSKGPAGNLAGLGMLSGAVTVVASIAMLVPTIGRLAAGDFTALIPLLTMLAGAAGMWAASRNGA